MHNNNLPYFDRNTTNIIKGIALIMMFIHHFYTIPGWWVEGISYPLIEKFTLYFCMPSKLCVSIFCFITGYFYFYQKNKTYKYALKKITDFLITYWCIFFICAIIAIVCLDYQYTLKNFIKECLALHQPTMVFGWYVDIYISFMLTMPLIKKAMSKNIYSDFIIASIVVPFVLRTVQNYVDNATVNGMLRNSSEYFPLVLVGYIFANYNLFEKIYNLNIKRIKNNTLNIIVYVIVALIAPMGKWAEPTMTIAFSRLPSFYLNMDVFYTPIFIYVVANLCKVIDFKHIKFILVQIGKLSLPMWFVSCIFFNNCKSIFQPILYYPHNPIIVIIWGLILCFVPSYILDIGIKKIQNIKNKILN